LKYNFGDYLMGKALFSPTILQAEVAVQPLPGMVYPDKLTPRKPEAGERLSGYFFSVFGLTFSLILDSVIAGLPCRGKAISLSEPPNPIFLTDVRMDEVDEGRQRPEATAKPVGQLSREDGGEKGPG
jgi:hypothetical protein